MEARLKTIRRAMVAAFIVLNLADIVSTAVGLRRGFVEANYLPALVFERFGEIGIYGLKWAVSCLFLAVVLRLTRQWPRIWYALHTSTAIVAIVVLSNVYWLLEA